VDDWITQHTETAPGYFEGQKRGYWTTGSFSGRWQTQNDHLWSVSPLKVKAKNCGIDAFLGGVSFLDFDYMVKKLQNILQAAPAAAFDIALKTLCEQCSSTIKTLETMSSNLNSIQLDECKASEAMVATIAKPFYPESKQGQLAQIQGEFLQSSGVLDLWHAANKISEGNKDKPADDLKKAMKGCSPDVLAVFGTQGSVIDNLARQVGFNEAQYTDLIRGLTGDIIINANPDSYNVSFIPPCDRNQKFTIDDFLQGRVYARNDSGACYKITDTNKNLTNWVNKRMADIAQRTRAHSPLDASHESFINAIPFPVFAVIKTALGTNQEASVLATMSDITAKAYAFRIFADLYSKAINILEKGKTLAAAQSAAKPGSGAYECRIEMVSDAIYGIEQMQHEIFYYVESCRQSYAASAQEVNTVLGMTQKYSDFDVMANQKMTETFGSSVTQRAMKQ
jgi:conjugative transfer pilus assembly protein TraH